MLRKNEVAEEHVTNRAGTNFLTINPDGEKCKFMDFFSFLFIFHSAKWWKTQYCQVRVILVTPMFSLLGVYKEFFPLTPFSFLSKRCL